MLTTATRGLPPLYGVCGPLVLLTCIPRRRGMRLSRRVVGSYSLASSTAASVNAATERVSSAGHDRNAPSANDYISEN
jgi:hypothetical protein